MRPARGSTKIRAAEDLVEAVHKISLAENGNSGYGRQQDKGFSFGLRRKSKD